MMKRILRCGLFLLLLLLPAVSVSAGEAGQIQVEVGAKGLMKFYDSFPVKVTLSQWPEGEYEICLETVTGWPVSWISAILLKKYFCSMVVPAAGERTLSGAAK